VAEHHGNIKGYAYATKWKERSAYRYSVEISVYVDRERQGQGWGTKLYQALFTQLQKLDIHLAIGGITLPNDASIALHEKFGMIKVAHFQEIGFKFEQWLDVGYWQLEL
jgi:phosphinothricin acetyltransferase